MTGQKRLFRSTQDRMFAGVCGGIAEYLDVDPTLVRLVFVALAFMGGPGPIIYIVLMLIVPENPGIQWKHKRDELDDFDDMSFPQSSIQMPAEEMESGEVELEEDDFVPEDDIENTIDTEAS